MDTLTSHDPYAGNILIERLPPIMSRDAMTARLQRLPPMPPSVGDIPREIRMHLMRKMAGFHVPGFEELRLCESTDLMIRSCYARRDPNLAETWRIVGGETWCDPPELNTEAAAFVVGPSGTGKSQAIASCLALLPRMIHHPRFPMCVGGLDQVVSLSMNAPPSGRTLHLANRFMQTWNESLRTDRFAEELSKKSNRDGQTRFDTCCQVAKAAFLGVLHIDDVENLFSIPPLRQRKSTAKNKDAPSIGELRELRVIEDQCLKNLAHFINTAKIPLLLSGTNDGAATLQRRLSNAERLAGSGYHRFLPFSGPDDDDFRDVFLTALGRYQYVKTPIAVDDNLAQLIYDLTAGVRRIIVNLWMATHRVAFERESSDTLLPEDFRKAAATFMAPVADAVQALRSRDPERMSKYEDLLPRTEQSWESFWSP